MTLFLRSLFLGYGTAAAAAIWLSASGAALWAVILVIWIGGNMLALAFAAIGAWLWPVAPARASVFVATDAEFRLWDEDLARELIDAGLWRDDVPGQGQDAALRAWG